jgi:Domain of unknown function (DUF6969)
MLDFARLSRATLEAMDAHGRALRGCACELVAANRSVLDLALDGAPAVETWRHYPQGDVYDPASHAQYFYHAHPAGERAAPGQSAAKAAPEHGHFHTFLRGRGMPPGASPMVMPELAIADNPAAPKLPPSPSAPEAMAGEEADPWCHLVAIAMDAAGRPLRFFTTNRWVTGETWYPAADMASMLGSFHLAPAAPAPLLNLWIGALIGLYKPHLAALLQQRDAAVMEWRRRRRAKVHVLEDRRLEITSALEIDLDGEMERVAAALRRVA